MNATPSAPGAIRILLTEAHASAFHVPADLKFFDQ
jgi:hypothetical protein